MEVPDHVRAIFDQLDANQSGYIEENEISVFAEHLNLGSREVRNS